jgi:uncharacterized protein
VSGYTGPVVDVDVHHRQKKSGDITQYLPKFVRELVEGNPAFSRKLTPPGALGSQTLSNNGRRADAWGPEGEFPASSYEMLRDQLLDRFNYHRAILTHDLGDHALLFNSEIATALCSAANDWTIDEWLARDSRLRGLIVCPVQDPEAAVAEIRRLADHPAMDGILLVGSPLGVPFGHPAYHPIYAAAAELGLPLSIHPASAGAKGRTVPAPMMTTAASISLNSHQAALFVTSFIVHGVFEKYPSLRVVVKEYGVAWIPSLLWRMDQFYDVYRQESSWVRRWPSEYVHDHIKFSTQPLEVADDPRLVAQFLGSVDGMEDLLCFSSDYPHVSYDDVRYVARMLPRGWEAKVMYQNACSLYGWAFPTADGPEAEVAAEAQVV